MAHQPFKALPYPKDFTMHSWRGVYGDGRFYTSEHIRWQNLPREGIQAYRVYFDQEPYSAIVKNHDVLWLDEKHRTWMNGTGGFLGTLEDAWDRWSELPQSYFKVGTLIDFEEYKALLMALLELPRPLKRMEVRP